MDENRPLRQFDRGSAWIGVEEQRQLLVGDGIVDVGWRRVLDDTVLPGEVRQGPRGGVGSYRRVRLRSAKKDSQYPVAGGVEKAAMGF